tara:strand:+ start:293 stop:478 length:186 start_codon:yes stop_codon:yes gene_type:complete
MLSNWECSLYTSRANKFEESATWWYLPPNLKDVEIINCSLTNFKLRLKEFFRNTKIRKKRF